MRCLHPACGWIHSHCSRLLEGHSSRGPSSVYGRSSKTEVVLWPENWNCRIETWQFCPSQGRCLSREEKIKDRWEDNPHEVVCQIMTDVPLYEVKDLHRNSHILHYNWLLRVASEAGISLCMDVHQVWDGCTSPTSVKPTPGGSDSKIMPQEDNGLAITQHQTRKTSLGWVDWELWLLLWTSVRLSNEDGWRFLVMCSRHGCLPWQNGQHAHMHLVER